MDPSGGLVPAEFFGVVIPGKKSVKVGSNPDESDEFLDTFHLSQVALGPDAVAGRHVVWVEYEGTKSVIGTLTLGSIEQFQIDFPVNCEVKLSHSGKSDVYVTGYTTRQYLGYLSSGEEEEEESSEEEEALEEAPLAVPLTNGPAGGKSVTLQKQAVGMLTSSEEGSSEDEEEDAEEESDEDAAAALPVGLQTHQFSDMDADEDEDSEEDNSGDEGDALGIDSDDSDEAEDEEDEEDEKAAAAVASAAKAGAKRAAAATPLSVQQQQKKAKTAASPASAGTPRGTSEAKYQEDLVKYLKANGATKLAVLGSQVKRAAGLPKMKKFLSDRVAVFKVDEQNGMVSLA